MDFRQQPRDPYTRSVSDSCLDTTMDDIHSDDDMESILTDFGSSDHDGLNEMRTLCSVLDYPSLLDAILEDLSSDLPWKAPSKSQRLQLDEICHSYAERGMFKGCPKAIDNGLGKGACELSIPILQHEFEKLRTLPSLKSSTSSERQEERRVPLDIDEMHQAMSDVAPNFIHIFSELLSQSKEKEGSNMKTRRIVMVLAMLAHYRNTHYNSLQAAIGLFLFACKAGRRVIDILNSLGISISYCTVMRHIDVQAKAAAKRLKEIGARNEAFITVFDNLTFKSNVCQARLDNQSEYMVWTAGYVLIPPSSRRAAPFTPADINRERIKMLKHHDFIPNTDDHDILKKAFQAIIADTLVRFAQAEGVHLPKIDCDLPSVRRINRAEPPEILTLPTYDLNEANRNDMIQILYSIEEDIGLSKEQCGDTLAVYSGDLMTVDGMRHAIFRQSECSKHKRLKYIEVVMGMLHLFMAAVGLFFKVHYGNPGDVDSLSFWMDYLQRDPGKLWSDRDSLVKDFNACVDFFEILLDGYLVAALCQQLQNKATSTRKLIQTLPRYDAASLGAAVDSLTALVSDPHETTESTRSSKDGGVAPDYQDMMIFIKHALLLKTFLSAMKIGDTGLMIHALKFISVWFQGSNNHKYAMECLRLIACVQCGVWSEALVNFWMENALINLSGKRNGFIALDTMNEYIVREIKDRMPKNLTPSSDHLIRNVYSLLIMYMKNLRRTFSEQCEARGVLDQHSSRVDSWKDAKAVANRLLASGIAAGTNKGLPVPESPSTSHLYLKGIVGLAMGGVLGKLKQQWFDEEIIEFDEEADDTDDERASMRSGSDSDSDNF